MFSTMHIWGFYNIKYILLGTEVNISSNLGNITVY